MYISPLALFFLMYVISLNTQREEPDDPWGEIVTLNMED